MMSEAMWALNERVHRENCQKLQEFLLAEFPLDVCEGDDMIQVAIRLMKDMKGQIGRLTAGNAVFQERF